MSGVENEKVLEMMEEEASAASGSLFLSEPASPQPVSVPSGPAPPPISTAQISMGVTSVVSSAGEPSGKKKRGRPRKYDADGNLRVPLVSGGGEFTPHVMTVSRGEDITSKIISFSQSAHRGGGICVLSANGTLSSVTVRQPGSVDCVTSYEGCFEILSLTGSFLVSDKGGIRSRTGGLCVSLAGPDGHVMGGCVAGKLMASNPVQMVLGSFMPNGSSKPKKKKQKKIKQRVVDPPNNNNNTVIAPAPIPQSVQADKIISSSPTSSNNFMVPNHIDSAAAAAEDNNPNDDHNINGCWNGAISPALNKDSPEINISGPFEQCFPFH